LAGDSDVEVRQHVAQNSNTPPVAFEKLAEDSDAEVRLNVAQNSNTPPDVLGVMALDENLEVQRNALNTLQRAYPEKDMRSSP
jgi:hypothetical protein